MIPVPDFRELVGGDELDPQEEARLRRVHDLLVAAGPPPELPLVLARPPATHPRRWLGGLAMAAALAAAAFVGGYFVGHRGGAPETLRSLPMHGVGAASAASAVIEVYRPDSAGNYSFELRTDHMPSLPGVGYYVLYLTLQGKTVAACGIFMTAQDGTANVHMTLPGDVGKFDGWIITPGGETHAHQVLLTT